MHVITVLTKFELFVYYYYIIIWTYFFPFCIKHFMLLFLACFSIFVFLCLSLYVYLIFSVKNSNFFCFIFFFLVISKHQSIGAILVVHRLLRACKHLGRVRLNLHLAQQCVAEHQGVQRQWKRGNHLGSKFKRLNTQNNPTLFSPNLLLDISKIPLIFIW